MKILVISTMPHDKEGRINRLLHQIKNHDIYIYSPEVSNKNPENNYYSVSKEIPIGYIAQIKFYLKFKKQFKKNHDKNFFDIILVLNYSSLPFCKIAKKRNKNAEIIYDSFELIVKTRSEKKTLRDKFYIKQEKLIAEKSNYIIAANNERALIMQGYYRLDKKPYVIQNMPLELSIVQTKEIKENERISIVYIGYVSKTRKIENLVNCVYNNKEIWDLYIYGDGDYYEELLNYIEKMNMQNIYLEGRYNQNEIEKILSKHHIGYICYDTKGLNNIYCEPNKIYDYTFNYLPIISNYHPKLYGIFKEHKIGIALDDIEESLHRIVKEYKDYQEQLLKYNEKIKQEMIDNQQVLTLIIEDIKDKKKRERKGINDSKIR